MKLSSSELCESNIRRLVMLPIAMESPGLNHSTLIADRHFSILIKRVSSIIYVFLNAALIMSENLPQNRKF